jgi:hypothetical protein
VCETNTFSVYGLSNITIIHTESVYLDDKVDSKKLTGIYFKKTPFFYCEAKKQHFLEVY